MSEPKPQPPRQMPVDPQASEPKPKSLLARIRLLLPDHARPDAPGQERGLSANEV
ncbi:MAG: hypothetical protein R3C32_09295 [Chloroflexota bacterium]